jgi:hypothetical protein
MRKELDRIVMRKPTRKQSLAKDMRSNIKMDLAESDGKYMKLMKDEPRAIH